MQKDILHLNEFEVCGLCGPGGDCRDGVGSERRAGARNRNGPSGGDASYSDMVILPDMSIGLLYETSSTGWQSIWFTRLTLEWLTDDKDRVVPKAGPAPATAA